MISYQKLLKVFIFFRKLEVGFCCFSFPFFPQKSVENSFLRNLKISLFVKLGFCSCRKFYNSGFFRILSKSALNLWGRGGYNQIHEPPLEVISPRFVSLSSFISLASNKLQLIISLAPGTSIIMGQWSASTARVIVDTVNTFNCRVI